MGFGTICFLYADDFNLMIALMSLYITVPAILGILVLNEAPTWNNWLGLFSALTGIIVLSYKVKENIDCPSVRMSCLSKSSVCSTTQKISNIDTTPLLDDAL